MKKKKEMVEFRYYAVPADMKMLALQGDEWIQCFGEGVDSLHFHNHLELGYCYYGEGHIVVDKQNIPFEAGTCTIVPQNIPHATKSTLGTVSRWEYLFVDVEGIIEEMFPEQKIMSDEIVQMINHAAYVLGTDEESEIRSLILSILKEMETGPRFYKEQSYNLLRNLMIQIARFTDTGSEESRVEESSVGTIMPALNYISRFYYNTLKIGELAEKCFLSESHFRRVFGQCMNMTPSDYINLIRVQIACELMNKTNHSILEISNQVGFISPSTFNRNFRKVMGMSPIQWRNLPDNYERKILNWEIITKNT
ncbi:MAG: AraC family transcriptional regulator [Clostridia bacterium]|nr:AraC family transcriptional regulator [Clostridia bacterium]